MKIGDFRSLNHRISETMDRCFYYH